MVSHVDSVIYRLLHVDCNYMFTGPFHLPCTCERVPASSVPVRARVEPARHHLHDHCTQKRRPMCRCHHVELVKRIAKCSTSWTSAESAGESNGPDISSTLPSCHIRTFPWLACVSMPACLLRWWNNHIWWKIWLFFSKKKKMPQFHPKGEASSALANY